MLAIARHAETKNPVNQSSEDIAFCRHTQPGWVNRRLLHAAEQIEQADNDDQTGILKQGDNGVHQPRDHQLQGLRKNDQPLGFPVAQRQRLCCFVLPFR